MQKGSNITTPAHVPVLYAEALEALAVQPDGSYLDGTFGRGGHAQGVLERLGSGGRLLVMDKDPDAIAVAHAMFGTDPRVCIRQSSFATMADWPDAAAGLDGVLLDLGVSSPQLDEARRGFSFMQEGPLDMRMDSTSGESAAEFLAHADEREIADVLWRHGEERMSRRIARNIVAQRNEKPLVTTSDLAELVVSAVGRREPGKHPATRTFQALRIHVNRELEDLSEGLEAALACLRVGGRLVVISFHSLEDRITKQFIAGHARAPAANRRMPELTGFVPRLRSLGRAVKAGNAEVLRNPRARSAVLRVAEKLA